jgi:hypothetical protein
VPVAPKKTAQSTEKQLKTGSNVVLTKLPPRPLKGLPKGDQKAISTIVGVPVRLSGFDGGRLELEFVEDNGAIHFIYVDRQYVKMTQRGHRKPTKRRK